MTEPLVLIPGLNCTADLYAAQWPALAMGRPMLVAEHRRDDTLAAMAERLLAAAPERFALCGLSMGGYLAFEVMRRAAHRVTRLALLDTSPKPATPETNLVRAELIALAEAGKFTAVLPILWQKLVAPARLSDERLRATVTAMALATGAEAFIRQQRAIMARPDSRLSLGSIAVPTLVVVGSEDQITPVTEAREIAGAIRNATLEVVDGCGHLSPLEAPAAVTAALQRWLG